jgi:DMSO/TMAO reductase YedYZ molybdopterin-dependent catalytic subunit
MNGEALPVQHGYPLRLIVPGWYAVASVKWLTDVEVVAAPHDGHYQAEKYWYEWERNGEHVREPVTLMQVRALITEPGPGQEVHRGDMTIRGVAWSGAAPGARVEVSVCGGEWHRARLASERKRHSWQWWELQTRVDNPGLVSVRARAVDLTGRCQPDLAEWNRLGYGNNTVQEVTLHVT